MISADGFLSTDSFKVVDNYLNLDLIFTLCVHSTRSYVQRFLFSECAMCVNCVVCTVVVRLSNYISFDFILLSQAIRTKRQYVNKYSATVT